MPPLCQSPPGVRESHAAQATAGACEDGRMLWALIIAVVLLVLVALSNLALQKQVKHLQDEVTDLRADQDVSERVSYLVHRGRAVEAIALYRKATGLGLAQSKNAVDVIARNNPQL